ncbi:accessory factor UbiK family protein [Chelatococcus sambhunathii]|uniref:Accessory factor UbiK family protein n=1 Tax=Chelatococcus sambhunathii TaxID=363953 RepID=A0ABU1DH42_9HYPH|nr:accessory factor UbiK family protein [Chelatococcus sambhunathii]MDR4307360.1 accessory factor UbiK family protein [Chelatococcus sambhunathii]
MTEARGRVFDELGRLMTDAAGAAAGVRREVETAVKAQAARVLSELDVVRRDEFEAVKAMAAKAREENERLAERLAALEAQLRTRRDEVRGEPAPEPEADRVPDPGGGA